MKQVTCSRVLRQYRGAEWRDFEKEVHQQDIAESYVQSRGYPLHLLPRPIWQTSLGVQHQLVDLRVNLLGKQCEEACDRLVRSGPLIFHHIVPANPRGLVQVDSIPRERGAIHRTSEGRQFPASRSYAHAPTTRARWSQRSDLTDDEAEAQEAYNEYVRPNPHLTARVFRGGALALNELAKVCKIWLSC